MAPEILPEVDPALFGDIFKEGCAAGRSGGFTRKRKGPIEAKGEEKAKPISRTLHQYAVGCRQAD